MSGAAQLECFAPDSPHPDGSTPHWFTDRGWWLATEADLLRAGHIPRQFDLDPCGHNEAPVSGIIRARGGIVWTAAEDGLARSWAGACGWINPPYDADAMEAWCCETRARSALMAGAVALVPAFTDRAWWQDWIEPDRLDGRVLVRFIRGRLHFGWPGNPVGLGGDDARFPSALIIWRCR